MQIFKTLWSRSVCCNHSDVIACTKSTIWKQMVCPSPSKTLLIKTKQARTDGPTGYSCETCSVPLPSHYCHCSPQLAVTCSHLPPPPWADPPPFPCLYNERAEEEDFSALLRQNFVILVGTLEWDWKALYLQTYGVRQTKNLGVSLGCSRAVWCPAEPARVQVSWDSEVWKCIHWR